MNKLKYVQYTGFAKIDIMASYGISVYCYSRCAGRHWGVISVMELLENE